MIKNADDFIKELESSLVDDEDKYILSSLKKAYDDFNLTFKAKDAGNEIIRHFYENLRLSFIAALRHYNYISTYARDYVKAEITVHDLQQKFEKLEKGYSGQFEGQVPFAECNGILMDSLRLVDIGSVPAKEKIASLEQRVELCRQVLEAL